MLVWLTGTINSGKSTVGRLLAEKLGGHYLDCDSLVARDKALYKWVQGTLDAALERMCAAQEPVVADYPLRPVDWEYLHGALPHLRCICLAPPLEVVLTNRGTRELTEDEKERIKQMYATGYNKPPFAELVMNNHGQHPEETTAQILRHLQQKGAN